MVDVRVKLNMRGINTVMRAAQPFLDDIGERMAADAGPGFEYVARPHKWTARGYVQTANPAGMRQQRRDAVLERVMGTRR